MRPVFAAVLGILASYPVSALAQSAAPPVTTARWEAGLTYNYLRGNAPPDVCGCFSLQGGGLSAAYRMAPHWKGVGEFAGSHAGGINNRAIDVTLLTYLFGVRYVAMPSARAHPFAQVEVGGVHAGGSLYSAATSYTGSTNKFAMTTGGGLDVDLNSRVSLRLVQADYLLTLLPNGSNNHQNTLRLSTGFVFRF